MGSKGYKRKSRQILRKRPRERGMQPLGRMLHKYDLKDKVVIKIDSGFHKGMPHHRYYGKVAVVTERRGRAYVVELKEGGKVRKLIVRPEHIVPYSGDKANAKDIG